MKTHKCDLPNGEVDLEWTCPVCSTEWKFIKPFGMYPGWRAIRVRLQNGTGPYVTTPDWIYKPTPDPDEWVMWFDEQSGEARQVIAEHLLACERKLAELGVEL